MKALKRNQQTFYYCLLIPDVKEVVVDDQGYETGEILPAYDTAVEMKANISPATGYSNTEQFGNLVDYDRVIVTDDINCPIDENTVLFVGIEPDYSEVMTHEIIESNTVLGDDEIEEKTYLLPKYNYIVKRIAKSLNSVSIAIRKVDVS